MLGTANGALVHEAVHPCTALGRSFASTPEGCELLLLLLRQATAGMPEVEQRREQLPDAAETGPPCGAASVWREKPAGWRARCAPVRCQHMDVLSANRRSTLAQSEGMDARRPRHRGCVSLATFFAQAKKVARSPQASGNSAKRERRSRWIPAFAGMTSKDVLPPSREQNHPHPTLPLKGG